MDFKEAIAFLEIEEYGERIFNSNSHGELSHLDDYILIAEKIPKELVPVFKRFFENTVKYAEENWYRPESVFQHILKIMLSSKEIV